MKLIIRCFLAGRNVQATRIKRRRHSKGIRNGFGANREVRLRLCGPDEGPVDTGRRYLEGHLQIRIRGNRWYVLTSVLTLTLTLSMTVA